MKTAYDSYNHVKLSVAKHIKFDIISHMKEIRWSGSSLDDLCSFPEETRKEAGYLLHLVQSEFDPINWKPMTTIGSGVREIRLYEGGAYRVIYLAKYQEAVYVLHAFEKKTKQTRKADIDLAKARLKEIEAQRR